MTCVQQFGAPWANGRPINGRPFLLQSTPAPIARLRREAGLGTVVAPALLDRAWGAP